MTEPACHKQFNFCFWAKLLVAIPALPIVALLFAAPFHLLFMQILAAALGCALVVWLAVKIDRMPCLASKVRRG